MDGPDTAGREHDEDEIWRDIVARFDAPAEEDGGGTPPWPAQESLSGRMRVIRPAEGPPAPAEPDETAPGETASSESQNHGDDEHYVPPPPPPLPNLDPVTKGAWLALFGGPAYLLVTTVAGWTVPAWAAFCAVAAFVGGFITLVLRMSDDRGGGDDPGDGAVV